MLLRQSALYVLARILSGLVGMAMTAVLTRLLAPVSYGQYGLALLIMAFGGMLLFDWMGIALVRVYAGERRTEDTLRTFLQLFLVLALAVLLAAVPIARSVGISWYEGLAGAALVVAYAGFELSARLRVARQQAGPYLLMTLARNLLIAGIALPIAALTRDGLSTAIGMALGIALATGLAGSPVGFARLTRIDMKLARTILAYGLPIAAANILGSLVGSGTRALVGGLGSTEELGYYTAGFILIQNSLAMVGSGIESAAFPLAVAAVERGDEAAARDQLVRNAALLLAVLVPAALGMGLTAGGIAHNLVGSSFEPSVARLVPWLCAGALLGSLRANYLDHAFQLGRKPHLQVWVTGVSGAVAMALAAWLIPIEGAVGAAMAVTGANAVGCLHAVLAGRRAFHLPVPVGQAARIAAACAVMAVVVWLLPGRETGAFLAQVVLGAASYGTTAFALDVLGARHRVLAWLAMRLQAARGGTLGRDRA